MIAKVQLGLAVVVLAVLPVMCGCGGGTAPLSRERMLVFRSADSPVLTELRKTFREERYTGNQDPAKYSMVVIDGDTTAAQEVATTPLISDAIHKGVSVMFLDVSESHKAALTRAKLTQAHTNGDSAAYLVTPLPGGRIMHLTNLRRFALHQTFIQQRLDPAGFLTGTHQDSSSDVTIDGAHLNSFMGEVARRLQSQRSQVAPPTPPSDYSNSSWFQTYVTEVWAKVVPLMNDQSIAHLITYNFYVYFDSGATLPSKYFQWCVMSMDGFVEPSAPAVNTNTERGFAHTMFDADIVPVNTPAGNGLQLSLYTAQPNNVANTLTSNMQFSIGYKGGPNTAWLWNQTLTQQTPSFNGWEASSPPPPSQQINAVRLEEMQTSPCNGDASNWTAAIHDNTVDPMNAVSTAPMEVVGQVVWRTGDVFTGIVQIACSSFSTMMDISVPNSYCTISTTPTPVIINIDFSQVSAS